MVIDVLIIIFLISSVFRGRDIGLVRQLFSTAGFVGGLFLGAALQPYTARLASDPQSKALVAVLTTLASALIFLAVAEAFGVFTKHKLSGKLLDKTDASLGAVAGGLTLLLLIWLSTPVIQSLPIAGLQRALGSSRIVGALDRTLPSAPDALSRLGRLVYPNGFPQVFVGLEPTPVDAPLPELGTLRPAVEAARQSVVKVEGQGCGGVVDGSGFVAADGFVATNAHVVAGIKRPYVRDANGLRQGDVVWFDKNLDLAVLRVGKLAGKPLKLDRSDQKGGTASVILGYPGGGGFEADPANVMEKFTAVGRDIYDSGRTSRDIYSLKGKVVPGNSGGPLIDSQGEVIGVIFATSTSYDNVGYALTMRQVSDGIDQAVTLNQPRSTGQCAEG